MAVDGVRQGTVSQEISDLAYSLMARDRVPLNALKERRTFLTQRSSALSTVKTRLTALATQLDGLANIGSLSSFATKAASSSDTAVLGVSASTSAANATLSVTVQQLARRATHVSDLYTDTGTAISGAGTGTYQFGVTIAGTTHDVSVTIDPGADDKTVLDAVAEAISTAVGTAGSAVRIQAETGKSRLSVSSAESGTANKITFTDTDGLLARLGIVHGSPTASTATTGGYVYEDLGGHELDARLLVDGLTYYRDKNTVTDLLSGVTLDLKATSATAVTVKIQPDADKAIATIKDFIAKYNDVLDYLRQSTNVDVQGNTRGVLSLDSTFTTLPLELKRRAATIVSSQAADDPNSLAAIYVRAGRDGKLAISDESKLRELFAEDPAAIQSLFNAEDGVATTLRDYVERFTKGTGSIALTRNTISTRVTAIDGQISRLEVSLAKKQLRLEEELARNQALLIRLAQQQNQMMSFLPRY
jgi:flagellar hook-associated protein 2